MIKNALAILWGIVMVVIGALLLYYFQFTIGNHAKQSDEEPATYNLKHIDFTNCTKAFYLNGGANFYKDTLLTPADFNNRQLHPNAYIRITDNWKDHVASTKKRTGHGYGTFAIKVLVNKKGMYSLKVKDIKSAYKLFVNDKELGGSGKVGKSSKTMVPSRYQREFYFESDTDTINILIQVSNFHNRKGGLTGTIAFGNQSTIAYKKAKQASIEMFILGSLFILFIYHLALFAFRRKDKSILYFSLLCLAMFLRLGYIGEKLFLEAFSFLGWHVALKIEYISFYGLPVFTTLFLHQLFPKEYSRTIVKLTVQLSLATAIAILLLSPTSFSYIPLYSLIPLGFLSIYLLYGIFKALFKGRDFAIPVFGGFLFFFILSIHDALYYSNIINSIYLMPAGLYIATFSQAYVLAQKTSSTYSKVEKLSEDLKAHAHNLEQIVEARTLKIQQQKEEIEKQKIQVEETNKELIKLAQYKKNMTNMMIHDLKAPLNSIMGFTELSTNQNEFSKYVLSSGWEMENLIQNILDVDRYEAIELEPNKTKCNLYELANYAYENIYFLIKSNNISFTNNLDKSISIKVDKEAIYRVIVNILSNAVKHAGKGIQIKLTNSHISIDHKPFVKVEIYNSGKAIPKSNLDSIFNKYSSASSLTANASFSSGIGLAFCKLAVSIHGGEIGVTSGNEKGVTFWFTLPL